MEKTMENDVKASIFSGCGMWGLGFRVIMEKQIGKLMCFNGSWAYIGLYRDNVQCCGLRFLVPKP